MRKKTGVSLRPLRLTSAPSALKKLDFRLERLAASVLAMVFLIQRWTAQIAARF